MRRIALDLDGVFADFAEKARETHGDEFHKLPNNQFWPKMGQIPNLFKHLKMIPGSTELYKYAVSIPKHETFILTALPLPTDKLKTAKQDKHKWVHKHLGDIQVFTVFGGTNKKYWVKQPGDILIDDTKRNIDAWEEVGGVGIHHQGDFMDTINQLKSIVSKHK